MAEIKVCDVCKAQSPDPITGLYEANHWHEITYQSRIKWMPTIRTEEKWLLCSKCFDILEAFLRKDTDRLRSLLEPLTMEVS